MRRTLRLVISSQTTTNFPSPFPSKPIMKYSLLALLALAISPAPAEENAITENSPFNLQVIYHEKDHDPVEVNTVSTVDYTAMVPIERSETSTWICTVRFNLQPDQTLADISIADPKLSRIDEKAITYPTQLFQATVPFKNGAAIQVL